jgi:peptidoglycan/LPS O-acetylase OafA/YrhL
MQTERATEPAPTTTARIPSLDGWRGLAIGFVLISHLSGSLGYGRETAVLIGPIGQLGVRIFFIITGFLVTHLLLREMDKTGRIDLLKFWTRRAFRLLPAVLLFLGAVYLAAALGKIPLRWPHDYVFPLTFTMNYYPGRAWYWVHLWSLSAQIQFYLVWPLLMLTVGRTRVLHLGLAVIAVIPIVRLLTYNFLPISYTQGHSLETILDIFATGSLLAVLRQPLGESEGYQRLIRSSAMVGVVLLTLGLQVLFNYAKPRLVLGPLMNLTLAILIDRSTRIPGDWFGRLLASRPLLLLGTISYSLYVWQQPFINVGTPVPFPLSLLLALTAGATVYYFVERPFTYFGRQVRASS